MEMTVSAIQKIIEKRAAKKLDDALQKLSTFVREHPLLYETSSTAPMLAMDKSKVFENEQWEPSHPFWIFRYERSGSDPRSGFFISSAFMNQLREYWLPKFIEREAAELAQKVDEMEYSENAEEGEDL